MAPRAPLLSVVLAVCLLAPPAAAAPLRAPGVERLAGGALLVMPLRVEVYEIAQGGVALLRPEWTTSAREWVQAALDALLGDAPIPRTPYEPPADPERAERHGQVRRVHRLVQLTVVTHRYAQGQARDLPTKQGRLDWSLGPGAAVLGETTTARWALFLEVSQRRLGGDFVRFGSLGDETTATASVVDLATGDLLWFNHEPSGSLGTAAETLDTVKRLLRDFPL
jgi:hypothetical protein